MMSPRFGRNRSSRPRGTSRSPQCVRRPSGAQGAADQLESPPMRSPPSKDSEPASDPKPDRLRCQNDSPFGMDANAFVFPGLWRHARSKRPMREGPSTHRRSGPGSARRKFSAIRNEHFLYFGKDLSPRHRGTSRSPECVHRPSGAQGAADQLESPPMRSPLSKDSGLDSARGATSRSFPDRLSLWNDCESGRVSRAPAARALSAAPGPRDEEWPRPGGGWGAAPSFSA